MPTHWLEPRLWWLRICRSFTNIYHWKFRLSQRFQVCCSQQASQYERMRRKIHLNPWSVDGVCPSSLMTQFSRCFVFSTSELPLSPHIPCMIRSQNLQAVQKYNFRPPIVSMLCPAYDLALRFFRKDLACDICFCCPDHLVNLTLGVVLGRWSTTVDGLWIKSWKSAVHWRSRDMLSRSTTER